MEEQNQTQEPELTQEEIGETLAAGGPFIKVEWTEGTLSITKEWPFAEAVTFARDLSEEIERARKQYKVDEVNH